MKIIILTVFYVRTLCNKILVLIERMMKLK
jgi:hypothetical protein